MSNQVLDTFEIDSSPHGGSTTKTYEARNATDGEFADDTETVEVLSGIDRRRGARKSFSARILVPSAFQDLSPVMENNELVDITATFLSGDTDKIEQAKMTVMPVIQVVPDSVAVWYDTDTSVADNPDTDSDSSWTKLGEPLDQIDGNFEAITQENAANLPTYVRGQMTHQVEILPTGSAYSDLKTEYNNDNEIRIAFEDQGGDYLVYGNQSGGGVIIDEPRHMPAISPNERAHIVAPVKFSGDLSNTISYPPNAENLFYGATIEAEVFGREEGDFFTTTRTY